MINLVVYLNEQHNPTELVDHLLHLRLIAKGSIDTQNNSFSLKDDVVIKSIYSVITMQTRALLFKAIAQVIEKKYGSEIAMYATPIVASNDFFDSLVRNNTAQTIEKTDV
jgi:hypothetical protein